MKIPWKWKPVKLHVNKPNDNEVSDSSVEIVYKQGFGIMDDVTFIQNEIIFRIFMCA